MALHDQLLTKKMREARNAFEQRYRQRPAADRRGLVKLITLGETLLDPERPPETTLAAFAPRTRRGRRPRCRCDLRRTQHLEERGEIDALRARYPGAAGGISPRSSPCRSKASRGVSHPAGLDLVRQLDAGPRRTHARNGPHGVCAAQVSGGVAPTGWHHRAADVGTRAWRWPCAMACVRATSISPRADGTSPFRTWSMTRRAGRRSAIWPIPNSSSPRSPTTLSPVSSVNSMRWPSGLNAACRAMILRPSATTVCT